MRPGTLLRWHALKSLLKSEIKEGLNIIDIGSYDGTISYNLINLMPNLKITLVDIDKVGLQLAKKRGLNAICASALKLPIKDNQIDIVLCLDVIEHIKEDVELIGEISRILKKDGKVILTTPMQNGFLFPFLSTEKNKKINRDWGHVHSGYSLKKIKNLFNNNNLAVEKISKYFNYFSRFAYWFAYLSEIPLKNKDFFYRFLILLEPYIKYRDKEHIILGKKIEL